MSQSEEYFDEEDNEQININKEFQNNPQFALKKKRRSTEELKKIALDLSAYEPQKPLLTFTPETIKTTLMSYFKSCIAKNQFPTMTGVAMLLNMTRRELLTYFNSDPAITKAVTVAKQIVVEHAERLILSGRPPVGLIFWLKNNDDWVDRTEVVKHNKTMDEILQDLEGEGKTIINKPVQAEALPFFTAS